MGTIQDHLYPNKEVTRSLLHSGAWEAFLRSLRLEIRYSKRMAQDKLDDGSVDAGKSRRRGLLSASANTSSALLRLEFDYVVLYAYSLALRALQGKLRRRRMAKDKHYQSPSLLHMVEGLWIIESLVAARSIVEVALNVLDGRKMLRHCPSRIFHYVLFAITFLYKALAAGMVEDGEHNIAGMLETLVHALGKAAIDKQHFLYGFAILLKRLGKHWKPNDVTSPSILNRPAFERLENAQMSGPAAGASDPPPNPFVHPAANSSGTDMPFQDLRSFQFDMSGVDGASSVDAWNFDPLNQMPAADHEQDILFQSIWDNTNQDSSNLYATLLGDTFSFPEGFEW